MKKFLIRSVLFLLPFLALLLAYVILDPFMVLWHYSRYPRDAVVLNRDFVCTQVLLDNYQNEKYDSFILGSSRTLAFHTKDWARYIGNGKKMCHFDASNESIFGIATKVTFLDRLGVKIDNCLVLIDASPSCLAVIKDSTGILFMKDPRVIGGSMWAFQYENFKAFFSNHYFYDYFTQLRGLPSGNHYEPVANDIIMDRWENELAAGEDRYYAARVNVFNHRAPLTVLPPYLVSNTHKELLASMRDVFKRHKTQLRIVINPTYDPYQLNPADLKILQDTFGSENVFDLSGDNEMTRDIHNFYEASHYRPSLARRILETVYGPQH